MGYDSTGLYGMPYYGGFSNYGTTNNMYNATMPQGVSSELALPQNYSGGSGLTMPSQLTADTYQPQQASGGGVVSSALWAGGAGLLTYWLGNKFFSGSAEPVIKDGKVPENLVNAYDKIKLEEDITTKLKALKDAEMNRVLGESGLTLKQYEALQQLGKPGAEFSHLAPEIQAELTRFPFNVRTNSAASRMLESIRPGIESIDNTKLLEEATNAHRTSSLAYKTQQLERLNAAKSQIEGFAEHYNQNEIKTFIRNNPNNFFDTHGMSATQIEAEADRIALSHGQSRASLLSHYEGKISSAKTAVESTRTSLETAIKGHWSDSAKAFKSTAPEGLKNAISHAGGGRTTLFAGLVAGATFLYNMFGGNKS